MPAWSSVVCLAVAFVAAPALASGCAASSGEPASTESMAAAAGEYRIPDIGQVPLRVVLPISEWDRSFAADLYRIVQDINKVEGLHGTNAEISLVGWMGTENTSSPPERVIDELRASLHLPAGATIPGLEIVRTASNANHVFMQDLFEMLTVVRPNGRSSLALLDLNTAEEGSPLMNRDLSRALGVEAIAGELAPKGHLADDDDGGNVEANHEGRPYVGSSTTEGLRASLQKLTGQTPIVIPTDFLFVGHVDEYVAFLPSTDECKGALVYADPLEAINIMRQRNDVPLIPREDVEDEGKTSRDKDEYKKAFLSSLARFTRAGSVNKPVLELEDFDVSKGVRQFDEATQQIDIEFLGNLNAYQRIQQGVAELRKASKCLKQVVGVPSLFYSDSVTGDPSMVEDEIHHGYTAISGYLNLVSLRNHAVIAKEREEFFGPIVRERLAKILGDSSRVHEIDASFFEKGKGSVHCATNVIRSSERWRSSPAQPAGSASIVSKCSPGCVASNFCKEKVTSSNAKRVADGRPCVVDNAPGCKLSDEEKAIRCD